MKTGRRYTTAMIHELIAPFARRSIFTPVAILVADLIFYATTLCLAVTTTNFLLKFVFSSACGLGIGMLFIVGHDACHGSFTPSKLLNALIGRIAFVPSAHAFSLWALGHNRLHHRYTNFKDIDYVWRPLSKAEFDTASSARRILERVYRTMPGHALYYLVEIWWKKMVFSNPREVSPAKAVYLGDSILVTAGNALLVLLVVLLARATARPLTESIVFGLVWPFLVWNWLMGFVIYQHHTHPSVVWFSDLDDWQYWESQIEGTTHIKFPRIVNLLLHNIMEHPAHHALTGIPLYHLGKAQDRLESELRSAIVVQQWTIAGYRRTLRACKLYDYTCQRWLTFDGQPAAPP